MKTVLVNQARMGSTRLPGKVLKPVLGKPLLSYQLERLQRISSLDDLVIATTTHPSDDELQNYCHQNNVSCFRGSEENVLSRFLQVAEDHNADVLVRVTADCPLIDPDVCETVIQTFFKKQSEYDYVSNCLERSFPRGLDTEVFSVEALKKAHGLIKEQKHREHVTSYFYQNPDVFRCFNVASEKNHSSYRWTVDTKEDFYVIEEILKNIYPNNPRFSTQDVLRFLETRPDLVIANAHIEQKKVGE